MFKRYGNVIIKTYGVGLIYTGYKICVDIVDHSILMKNEG